MNASSTPLSLRWSMLFSALMLSAGLAQAQTLEFKECVTTALSQNPELGISRAQIEQAEAAVRQASGNRMPRVNLSLTASRSNDALNAFGMTLQQRSVGFADFGPPAPGFGEYPANLNTLNRPDAANNFNTRIELLVPVYNGGRVQSYVDTAKGYVKAAQSGDRMARQQLIKNVLQAYQGVHTARAYIQVAEEGQKAAEEYVRITEKLREQGIGVKSDVLSARVNLEEVRTKLTRARNAEAAALDQLHLLLGKPLAEPLDVGAPVTPAMLEGDLASLQAQAQEQNPGLAALRSQAEASGAQVRAAQAGKKPQFNVMLRQDWNDDTLGLDASSYTAAGVLSWTPFDGGTTQAAIDRAEASRSELAAKLRQAQDGIGYQVSEARRQALEAEGLIAARELAVQDAEEAQRLVKKRFENGLGTLIELLAAQAQLDKARADLVAARYELAVNRAELKRAVGVLAAENL